MHLVVKLSKLISPVINTNTENSEH